MFLHTYTFATNRISLVLEELTLCRNVHQVQVKYIKRRHSGKRNAKTRGRSPPKDQTWANPWHHHGPGPARGQPCEGGAEGAQPRRTRALVGAPWAHLTLVVRSSIGVGGAGVYSGNIPQTDQATPI
jgi:hypothetical protein